jgi:putative phosphoesterase
MLLGVVSDSHGRNVTVGLALEELRRRGVQTVLHCGDIDDESTIALFRDFTAHFVFGNCDYDRESLAAAIADIGATLHESWGQLELEGVKIAFLHGDDSRLKREVENSGYFDFLFYGHTHVPEEHKVGLTRVINPGALHRARPKTFLVLELPAGNVEQITVE